MNRGHVARTPTARTPAFPRHGPTPQASAIRGIKGAIGIHEDDDPGGKAHKKLEDDPPYANEYNIPKDHR